MLSLLLFLGEGLLGGVLFALIVISRKYVEKLKKGGWKWALSIIALFLYGFSLYFLYLKVIDGSSTSEFSCFWLGFLISLAPVLWTARRE